MRGIAAAAERRPFAIDRYLSRAFRSRVCEDDLEHLENRYSGKGLRSQLIQLREWTILKPKFLWILTDDTGGKPDEIVETETIKGRNGGTVIRETRRDGSVNVKRTNKKGNVTVDLGDVYDMAAAVKDATRKAEETRPNSQLSIVWVSDGIAPIFFEDRDATEQILIRNNVIFNSLTVELRTLFKFLLPVAKPIGGWLGMSLYGSAKLLAQRGTRMVADRVRGEFREMPGLALTLGQASRLWSLDEATCAEVLAQLVSTGFLCQRPDGAFCRA
jgi:hypothetical protein